MNRFGDLPAPVAEPPPELPQPARLAWNRLPEQWEELRESLARLRLNDASFQFEPESSAALGLGFRCGFLGLLHLEIIQERLAREFNLDLVATSPSVIYRVHMNDGEVKDVHNPAFGAVRNRLNDGQKVTKSRDMQEVRHSRPPGIGTLRDGK